MKFRLRKGISVILCLSTMITLSGVKKTNAANDTEASNYGFSVDNGQYKTSKWYNIVKTNVYYGSDKIGVYTVSIGHTRAKEKVSGNKYLDNFMVKMTMKGVDADDDKVGYAEHLTMETNIPSSAQLVSYTPESEAGMVSYNVGVNGSSDKKVGISASTTVTKKALEINNYCDTSEGLVKICYDYIHHVFRPNWKLSKYSYNESVQRADYSIKTSKSKYDCSLTVKGKFELWDDTPGFWANELCEYRTRETQINYTTYY